MLLEYAGSREAPKRTVQTPQQVHAYLNKRFAALMAERDTGEWLSHWREISDYILPRRGRFMLRDPRRGRKVNRNMLSPVPFRAAETFANGINAGLTSKSRQWFNLSVAAVDRRLLEIQAVRVWLSDCERLLMQWMESSNFYTVLPEVYIELAVFGTHASVVMEDDAKVFRIDILMAGEYALAVNMAGLPYALVRECEYTVEQMVETFGLEYCSETVQRQWNCKDYSARHCVRHIIEPNRDMVPEAPGVDGMPFRSIYWEPNCPLKKSFLQFKGFEENPLLAPRWSVSGNEAYGRCPGMDALPECKQLKQAIIRKEQGKERLTVPPMTAPASLKNAGANLLPGAVNYLDSTDGQVFKSVYERYDPKLDLQMKDIAELEAKIQTIFYNDLLFAISRMEGVQPRNIVEIMERKEEKLQQIGSGIERFETEFLERVIDIIWAIGVRKNLLPPPPRQIIGKEIKVVFVGPLALAQKQQSIMSLERTLSLIGSMAKSFPEAADKLNVDGAIDEYADLTNSPPSMIRSDEEVMAIRKTREAVTKQREMMAGAPQAIQRVSQGAELLSRTRTATGASALDQVEQATGAL